MRLIVPRMEESSRHDPTDPVIVARRLAAVREALGLRRSEFADRIGVDRSSYTKIEDGDKPILPPLAFRIWELYGVDMNFVYLGQIGGLPASLSSKVISHLKGTQA